MIATGYSMQRVIKHLSSQPEALSNGTTGIYTSKRRHDVRMHTNVSCALRKKTESAEKWGILFKEKAQCFFSNPYSRIGCINLELFYSTLL